MHLLGLPLSADDRSARSATERLVAHSLKAAGYVHELNCTVRVGGK